MITATQFSTTSDLTKSVCERIGFRFDINFVQTRETENAVIVAGTFGKPEEFRSLKDAVLGLGQGYGYEGVDGEIVYGRDLTAAERDLIATLEAEEREAELREAGL
jgi:hypothetical protein